MENNVEKESSKELPMNWWKFWQYFLFPARIILTIFSVIQINGINFSTLDIYGWFFIVVDIAMFILLCYTYIDFKLRKKQIYNVFMFYLVSYTIWRTFVITLNNTLGTQNFITDTNTVFIEVFRTFLISSIIMLGVWVYPNYLYFKKRKELFCN